MEKFFKNKKELLLIVFSLGLAAYMLLRFVNLPYVGPNATDQNKLSMIARNYNYFGLFETKFQPIIYPYKTMPADPQLYFNHGVLMEVVASFFMKVFGVSFWVGRIPYIIAAFLILPTMFFIGMQLKNKNFGILLMTVSALIPAITVFGRAAHYQGSFSLLFITLTGFFALKFVQSKKINFLLFATISGVLGVLTDWPITYFSLFLLPLFFKNKVGRQGLLLAGIIIGAGILLLSYINTFIPIASGLLSAIGNRSLGPQLTSIPFWHISWALIIFARLLIYFNPIFISLSVVFAFYFFKRLKEKKLNNLDLLTFAFSAYAITYILIFPEGSFSHPNWTYGLAPGLALMTAESLFPLLKNRLILLIGILVLSTIYVLIVENWKTNQNIANLYRYNLAKSISKYLTPYETVTLNDGNIIDFDIFNYSFLVRTRQANAYSDDFKDAKYFIFSCICDLGNDQVNFLANKYKFEEYYSPPGRVFVFFLNEKQDKKFPMIKSVEEEKTEVAAPPENLYKKIYRLIVDYLRVPQL